MEIGNRQELRIALSTKLTSTFCLQTSSPFEKQDKRVEKERTSKSQFSLISHISPLVLSQNEELAGYSTS